HFGSYSDVEGTALAAVRITTLPATGRLEHNNGSSWQPVTQDQVIVATDISAGKLRFSTAADGNGIGYAAIGFKVGDGAAFSAASYTLTVQVVLPGAFVTAPALPVAAPSTQPAVAASSPASTASLAEAPSASTGATSGNGHSASFDAALGAALPQENFVVLRTSETTNLLERASTTRLGAREFSGTAEENDFVLVTGSQLALSPTLLQDFLGGSSRSAAFDEGMDRLREAVENETKLEHLASGAAAAAGLGFSVGYVVWLVRGGILMTSLMSSLPAWRMLDPLPVLARVDDEDTDEAMEPQA
ncbi:MAG TPA: hypothetical protein VJT77_07825, partial [Burkholderiales bacterium]|nr:hypothetical protein [Burkholderiales bacterium]